MDDQTLNSDTISVKPKRVRRPKTPPPPPPKRRRSGGWLAALIVLLVMGVGILAGGYVLQLRALQEKEQTIQHLQDAQKPVEVEPVPTPPAPEPVVKRDTSSRAAFETLISPDNKWLLAVEQTGTANELRSVVRLESLIGEPAKVLVDSGAKTLPDGTANMLWRPVGWGFDGKQVYVAMRGASDAATERNPALRTPPAGAHLYAITVATGEWDAIFSLPEDINEVEHGIYDVSSEKGVVVYALPGEGQYELDIWLSDLEGTTRRKAYTIPSTSGIPRLAAAMLSPDASQLAVVTYTSLRNVYTYTLTRVDLRSGEHAVIPSAPSDQPWQLIRWKDAKMVELMVFVTPDRSQRLLLPVDGSAPPQENIPAASN